MKKIKYIGSISPAVLCLKVEKRRIVSVERNKIYKVTEREFEELIKQESNWQSPEFNPAIKKVRKRRKKK